MQTVLMKIGTRSSPLAMIQAAQVRDRLIKAHGLCSAQIEILPMSTQGDRITDRPLAQIGGKGLFTQEIEQALITKRIDIAVHSTKDMPTKLPEGLQLGTFLPREDPRDAFIGVERQMRVVSLPLGACIGTSSLRRQAFIRHFRPDLTIMPLRGNVETRLTKLQQGPMQGTFLSVAGLNRLQLGGVISEILEPDIMLPALGQGAIAIESRIEDEKIARLLAPIGCAETYDILSCERSFLAALDGSCRTPLGGLAQIKQFPKSVKRFSDKNCGKNKELEQFVEPSETKIALAPTGLHFVGAIASLDGTAYHQVEMVGGRDEAAQIGRIAAEKLRRDAPRGFFDHWG